MLDLVLQMLGLFLQLLKLLRISLEGFALAA